MSPDTALHALKLDGACDCEYCLQRQRVLAGRREKRVWFGSRGKPLQEGVGWTNLRDQHQDIISLVAFHQDDSCKCSKAHGDPAGNQHDYTCDDQAACIRLVEIICCLCHGCMMHVRCSMVIEVDFLGQQISTFLRSTSFGFDA